jgi:hypothetical protein
MVRNYDGYFGTASRYECTQVANSFRKNWFLYPYQKTIRDLMLAGL